MSDPTPPRRQEPPEDLSFGSLRDEMGDVFPARQEVEVPEVDAAGELRSLAEQEELREKKEWEAKINARVLGESGSTAGPMWVKGLVLVGVSILLVLFLLPNSSFAPFNVWVTIIVAAGAVLWNGNGVLKDDEPRDKGIAAALALVSLVIVALAWTRM